MARPRLRRLGGLPTLLLALVLPSCGDANPAFFHQEVSEFHQEPTDVVRGTAGLPLEELPAVQVRDGRGNPVPGVKVAFQVEEGDGAVRPDTVVTDREGKARPDEWILGETAGPNTLVADLGPFGMATFRAEGEVGPAARFERLSPEVQQGRVGRPVPVPPAVRVTDRFGNPVEDVEVVFTLEEGHSELVGATSRTDGEGRAGVSAWLLGEEEGTSRARGFAEGVGEIFFEATAVEPDGEGAYGLMVEGVHLNQGNQSKDGSVGGVAGRPGLLRVVLSAREANDLAPDVLVRLHTDGGVREERISAPSGSVPLDPDLAQSEDTWDLELSSAEVREGLAVDVVVDPDSTLSGDRYGFRYPYGDRPHSLDVQTIPPLNVRFIPVHWEASGRTGEVGPSNVDGFLERTRQWIPTAEVSPEILGTFTTDRDLTTTQGWVGLLSDLQAVRIDDGATDEYYQGIVPRTRGAPVGGMAYLLADPASRSRVAVSHDHLPRASSIVAHELGHNMGRRHAPCGGPERVDADFPYARARIGPPGYNVRSKGLVDPGPRYDYMSYCSPNWTSDYTYEALLEWRRSDALAAEGALLAGPGTSAGPGGEEEGALLLWGTVGPQDAVLNPAFSVKAAPRLPEEEGPYQLRGLDEDGQEVFSLSFRGERLGHGPTDLRHFGFAVPLDESERERLEWIQLEGPSASAERRAGSQGGGEERRMAFDGSDVQEAHGVTAALEGGDLRLSWDRGRHEAVLVRDQVTGRIRGISRSGTLSVPISGGPANADGRLEVLVSDGVTSRPLEPEFRKR